MPPSSRQLPYLPNAPTFYKQKLPLPIIYHRFNLAIKKRNIYLRYDSYNIPINWRRIPRVSGFLISSLTVAIITPSVNSPFLGANKCVGVTTADEPHSIRDHQNGYVPEHGFGPVRRARKVSGLWAQA